MPSWLPYYSLPQFKKTTHCQAIKHKGPFNIYVNKERWVGSQSNVYYYEKNTLFYLLCLFTKGRWVVKTGQNSVYVNIEWHRISLERSKSLWKDLNLFC